MVCQQIGELCDQRKAMTQYKLTSSKSHLLHVRSIEGIGGNLPN
jgi:hypothetical protein